MTFWTTAEYDPVGYRQAMLRENAPLSLLSAVKKYGREAVHMALRNQTAKALAALGTDDKNLMQISSLVADACLRSSRIASFRMPTLVMFFSALSCGEFKIYGAVSAKGVIDALQAAHDTLNAVEAPLLKERATRLYLKATQQERDNSITWEQYASRHNIDLDKFPTMTKYIEQSNLAHDVTPPSDKRLEQE